MNNAYRDSGIPALGDIPWGSHFCQFYSDEQDLIETLVPYFEAGLRGNEACFWIASGKLAAEKAESLMIDAVPDFKKYIARRQIQIVSTEDSYTKGGAFGIDAMLQGWLDLTEEMRARGFAGLRATGDANWVGRSGWNDFMEYESKVNQSIRQHRLIGLCTYCMDSCLAEDVIDVCCNHQFALARRNGKLELLESSSLKVAKETLMQLNADLETRVLERTTALNSALRSRDEFLAMLGHELRNPLASIRSASEVIHILAPSGSLIADNSLILHRQVKHLTRLVDDLLDVGRIDQGHIQLDLKQVVLADVIALAVEQSRPLIDQHWHSLSVTLPSRSVIVYADATRLAQVFGNLLHNAAKYTPNGGTVSIAAKVCDSRVVVSVKDTGCGIPKDMLTSIFDLFAQVPRSLDRSDGGLGVGLTVAKRLVDMHMGIISAASEGVDKGAEFSVSLALSSVQPSTADDREFQPNLAKKGLSRILVVDDNPDVRNPMISLLSIYGYEVKSAADGEAALALAKAFMPAAIFLDIGLPGINGYEIAKQLRSMPENKDIKLIALTGYGKDADILLAKEAGLDFHLLKPAQPEDLISILKDIEGDS